MLVCGNCESREIEIVDASDTHTEHGEDVSFWEKYECPICDKTGKYHLSADNSERITGCLTSVNGGVV